MMNRRQHLATLTGTLVSAQLRTYGSTDTMQDAAAIIQKQIDNGTLNAAVLHVTRKGQSRTLAFGKAKPDSMFLLGSITKPFTAVAIMKLVDQGALRLGDKAVTYLPEFSKGERKDITIEQLLTHTSGLPDQLISNNAMRAAHAPLSEFVKESVKTPLLFQPGTKYHYQSMGILLAAEIVQRVTKTSLPEWLDKEVFKPLGMNHTVLGLGTHRKDDMMSMQTEHAAPEAGAGDPTAKTWDWNSDYWRNLAAPWGGAHSTAADLDRFLTSFMKPDGKVLKPDSARLMITDHTPKLEAHRGIGFMVGPEGFGRHCSHSTFGHSGSTGTLAWADPETETVCIILTTLPKNVSGDLILHPVADLVSEG